MIDDLEALRALRAGVEVPSAAARRAARTRWSGEPIQLATTVPVRRASAAKTFTMRAAIAGVVAVAVVAGAWSITRARIDSVKPKHVVAVGSLTDAAATDPQVFLLVGSDSRAFVKSGTQVQQFGDPNTIMGARSDTIMLVRIDPATHHALLVSIPRDLSLTIPGHGTNKINAAFAFGGVPLLTETITQDLGVAINHVIEVQFPQFVSLVDQLGGIRINFPTPTRDAFTGLDQSAGCITLAGTQALAFVRSRHYEYLANGKWIEDPTADLGREHRQQLALRQLAADAGSNVGTDPRPLLRALFATVTVDTGFTADDALRYFTAMRDDHSTETMTLPVQAGPQQSKRGRTRSRRTTGTRRAQRPPRPEHICAE